MNYINNILLLQLLSGVAQTYGRRKNAKGRKERYISEKEK